MDKIKIGSTYGYNDFITAGQQQYLLDWVKGNHHNFQKNIVSSNRYFGIIQQFTNAPMDLINQLRNQIVDLEDIKDYKEEPMYQDYIGINLEGGAIHTHTDPNQPPYIHTRYNIILSYPNQGGESLYGDDVNILYERLVWKCIAGKVKHGSTPVVGKKPRITLSLGFLINDK